MDNLILKNLLKEYEQARIKSIQDLDVLKSDLYTRIPRFLEIETELNSCAILTAKQILQTNNKDAVKNLKKQVEKLQKEKLSILNSDGKDESFLLPKYNCGICKDTGYIFDNNKTIMCSCLKQKLLDIQYNRSNISNLEKENFKKFNINLYSDKVDEKKYDSSISPRENMKEIKIASYDFIKNFDDSNSKNLLFTGGTGLGKTFLSNCIAGEIMKLGRTVLYQTAPVMLDKIIADIFSKTSDNSFAENLLNVDLLIIDDLGTETMNSMKFTELYKIINTRILNQEGRITKTIISTNLNLQGLFNTYDERIVSRLVGFYNIYRFFGDDIRFKK